MKKSILYLATLLSLFAYPIQEAIAKPIPISFYAGAKLGYHNSTIDNIAIRTPSGSLTTVYNAPPSHDTSAFPIGISTGIIIPFTPIFAMRAELEYSFVAPYTSSFPLSYPGIGNLGISFSTTMHRFFTNMYLDLYTTEKLYLYATGGVGLALIDVKAGAAYNGSAKDTSATQFAWNIGAGVGYHITKKIFLDLGIRYVDSGSVDKYQTFQPNGAPRFDMKTDYSSVEFLLSVAYKF